MKIFTFGLKKIIAPLTLLACFSIQYGVNAQIPTNYQVVEGVDPITLVQQILIGDGVETSNITYSGATVARGSFSGTSNIGIESGVILCSGKASLSKGPNNNAGAGFANNTPGDAALNQAGGGTSYDAAILEFDFIPQSNIVEFKYVFGSEEYNEYVGSYNDVFGFFISGPDIFGDYPSPPEFPQGARNIAIVPGSLPPMPVSINNVNCGTDGQPPSGTNCDYFVNNPSGSQYIQYDGFTTVLIARSPVTPCLKYHIKLAVADMVDHVYDTGVWLEANSFSSVGVGANLGFTHAEVDTAVEGCNSASVTFKLFQITPVDYTIDLTVAGTAIEGEDYVAIPHQIIIPMGDTTATLTIDPIADGMPELTNETVQLIYNSSLCGVTMDTVTLYIKDLAPFSASFSPGGQDIICHDSVYLYGSVDGGQQPYHYQWSSGETTETIWAKPITSTVYEVKVGDVCGRADSAQIAVNVIGPDAIAKDDFSVCLNAPAQLEVQGGTSWKWTADPPDLSLTSAIDTLQNPIVYPQQNTTYTVTVFDECGNTDSDAVYVLVGTPYANAGADDIICTGDTYTLNANYTLNGVYVWTEKLTGNIVGNAQQVDVTPSVTTIYEVSVTDDCGNTATDEVQITVTQLVITVSSDPTICAGDDVTLTASSSLGGGIFEWNGGGNTYYGSSVIVSPDVTTTYIVTVDDGCIKDGPPVTVNVNQLPTVTASAPVSDICPDESVVLTAGGATSYVWTSNTGDATLVGQETMVSPSVSPVISTLYTVTGTDGNNCVNTSQVGITVKPRMFADFILSPAQICEDEQITVTYQGNGSGAATYDWNFDGGIANPGTGQGPHQVSWSTMSSKTVTLTVTQSGCVSQPFTQTLQVNQMPNANFSYGLTKGCVPLTVDFTNLSTNTDAGATYLWDFGAAGTSNTQSPSYEFTQPGTYDVTMTVNNPGCSNQMSVPTLVEAYPVPVASFEANPDKTSLKTPIITFSSTSVDNNLTYNWLTDDGGAYDVPQFTHTYADSGVYVVKMKIINEYGCPDSTTRIVTITPRYMLQIPTAFSPNNDGMNDKFEVRGNGVKKFRMSIYNSWGSLIFESESISKSWDGIVNGQPALPGVYIYRTYFQDENDEVSEQTGSIILIK